jgi:nitronate monooxygenase
VSAASQECSWLLKLLFFAVRQTLLKATAADTVRTSFFDTMRGTVGWPENIDGRAFKTALYESYSEGKLSEEEARNEYAHGEAVVWAGMGVGAINKIQSAELTVREIERELTTQEQCK